MQTNNRLFDDLAALMTNAAGAAKGMREELAQVMRQQGERMAVDLDLANREELDVLKDLVHKSMDKIAELEAKVDDLESKLQSQSAPDGSPLKSKAKPEKPAKKSAKKPNKKIGD